MARRVFFHPFTVTVPAHQTFIDPVGSIHAVSSHVDNGSLGREQPRTFLYVAHTSKVLDTLCTRSLRNADAVYKLVPPFAQPRMTLSTDASHPCFRGTIEGGAAVNKC